MGHDAHASARPRRIVAVAAAAAVLAAVVAVQTATGTAGAAPKTVVLGAAAPATPSCPDSCQAIGKTTGFQTSIGKTRSPFAAPFTGKIVAWSIKLSQPSTKKTGDEDESQMEFFNRVFDGPPSARISVLQPIRKKIKAGKPVYKLKGQSPLEQLGPYLGSTTTFTLQRPLKVKDGHVVALTVPTWAPAFAVGQGGNTAWQASRQKKKCGTSDDANKNTQQILSGRPQQGLGKDRIYGCTYKTARLLYSATVVAKP
jgi:hypothetical protein